MTIGERTPTHRYKYLTAWLIFLALTGFSPGRAVAERPYPEQDWGLGAYVRTATIPYDTEDNHVTSFVPVMFYRGERFFLNGLEGGATLFRTGRHQMDALGRLRFFDIPRAYQNRIQEDTVDAGLRYRFRMLEGLFADLEVMTDDRGRWHANAGTVWETGVGPLAFAPFIRLRHKDGRFNDHYFGLNRLPVGSGRDLSLGTDARLHAWKNLYLIGRVRSTWLEKEIRSLPFIPRDRMDELYLGMAVMADRAKEKKPRLPVNAYLRLSHGWATPSNIGQIAAGEFNLDRDRNQLSSLFYGHPLTDRVFDLPLDIYLTPGFLWNWKSATQPSIQEYVVAVKAYYTFPLPVRVRFGAAEGLSYASDIPHVEKSEMERKGYEPSNLMNYLDFSLDVNAGDLFGRAQWDHIFVGYAIHHRSAIFGTASHFGRVSGGANFHTLYIQVHF